MENNIKSKSNNKSNDKSNNKSNDKRFLIMYIILAMMALIIIILTITIFVFVSNNNKEDSEEYILDNIDEDTYFEENLETIEVNDVGEDNTFSEEEVIKFLAERGIYGKITTFYDINGNEHDEKEISSTSKEKHPDYSLMYKDENESESESENENSIWNILVIGKEIIAYPFEYNVENNVAILNSVLETDFLNSYDSEKNRFLKTVPNKENLLVTKVQKIDKKTLDELAKTKFIIKKD